MLFLDTVSWVLEGLQIFVIWADPFGLGLGFGVQGSWKCWSLRRNFEVNEPELEEEPGKHGLFDSIWNLRHGKPPAVR